MPTNNKFTFNCSGTGNNSVHVNGNAKPHTEPTPMPSVPNVLHLRKRYGNMRPYSSGWLNLSSICGHTLSL